MRYGVLTVACGPMYAGKTTETLKRILWARAGEGKRVLVVKPAFDDRYSTTRVVSHDGLSSEAESITAWEQVAALAETAQVVCFDEVQFFTDPHFDGELAEIVRSLLAKGIDVVAGGLDMDWQGHPFRVTGELAAMADELIKLTANCTVCGRPARKTFKKTHEGGQVELGAGELYEARCNEHWVSYFTEEFL